MVRRVGTGTSAQVFLGEDLALRRKVALKRVLIAGAGNELERELAIHEGRSVARLHHASIAQVYDVVPTTDAVWLVEEYVDGRSLQALLDDRVQIPRSRAQLWIQQVALGLAAAAESGIVHRDIKPGNIMIDRAWNTKLVDFGVAANRRHLSSAAHGLLEGAGTPAYLAPELVLGLPATDRVDVYALGVLAYVLYTGRHPFQHHAGNVDEMTVAHVQEKARAPNRVDGTISRRQSKLIMAALAKDDRRRLGAAEFAARWI